MFASRQNNLLKILASHTPETLIRDLLFNTSDHVERVRIIDRVRREAPESISTLYTYLISDNKFELPPSAGTDPKRKGMIINELENALLKQAIEDKTYIDLAVYSPRPGRSN
jgi:hypothetical protein